MVGEQHRLSMLEMGHPGQDGVAIGLRGPDKGAAEPEGLPP